MINTDSVAGECGQSKHLTWCHSPLKNALSWLIDEAIVPVLRPLLGSANFCCVIV